MSSPCASLRCATQRPRMTARNAMSALPRAMQDTARRYRWTEIVKAYRTPADTDDAARRC